MSGMGNHCSIRQHRHTCIIFAYDSWIESGLNCRKASFTGSTGVAAILPVTKLSASDSSFGFFSSCMTCKSRSDEGIVEIFSKNHDVERG